MLTVSRWRFPLIGSLSAAILSPSVQAASLPPASLGGFDPVAASARPLSDFDIALDLDFAGSRLDPAEQARMTRAYDQAEDFWERNILGYRVDSAVLRGITIDASVLPIDGAGGILGQAGPSFIYRSPTLAHGSPVYTSAGRMRFDTADIAGLLSAGSFPDLVLHEMAHVLGFGTLWVTNDLYVEGSGQYTGPEAVAKYNQEFGNSDAFIPVELAGGPGTADRHWAEVSTLWDGGSDELMTGYLDVASYVSNTTLYQFRDLGYITADHVVIPVPPSLAGMIGALAALGALARRGT